MTHSFNVEFAVKYGVYSSLIIGQIDYWCLKNQAKNKHLHNGRYWTFNSIKELSKMFPYLTERQVNYYIDKLKKEDLLLTANFNKNVLDKTTWYSLSNKALTILRNGKTDFTKSSNRFYGIVKSTTLYTKSITNTKERNIKERKGPTLKEIESFIKERNSPVNAQRFYDYYSVNNWKDKNGVSVLSNWKQRVISWEKDEKRPSKEKVEFTESENKFYGERNGIF